METTTFDKYFINPANWVVAGPSGCGKSTFIFSVLTNLKDMFEIPPDKVLYCYNIYQSLFEKIENTLPFVTFHQNIPNEETIEEFGKSSSSPKLLVLDYLSHRLDESVELLFTQRSHHMNITVIFITQNLFYRSKQNRTLQLNTHYYVIFKNFRDTGQIACLGRQIYSQKWKYFLDAYEDSTSRKYGYFIVDLNPHSNNNFRLRTNIFLEHEPGVIVYRI